MWFVEEWVSCSCCGGFGREAHELKGARIITSKSCSQCFGFGRKLHRRKPTLAEIEEMKAEYEG